MTAKKPRIKWIDTTRCYGIFFIYLGHAIDTQNKLFSFLFAFHVPLFFFLSGCTDNFVGREGYIKKNFRNIILPWLFFVIMSLICGILNNDVTIDEAIGWWKIAMRGTIRNQFIGYSLWFLTCLFVVKILFYCIKPFNNILILASGVVCYLISIRCLGHHPARTPSWFFNIDSALYYFIYYCIGYISLQFIEQLFYNKKVVTKIIILVTGFLSFIYTALLYWRIDLLDKILQIEYLGIVAYIIRTLIIIWFILLVAKFTEDIAVLNNLGKDSLYLCGTEYVIKTCVVKFLESLGIMVLSDRGYFTNPLGACIYVIICLYLAEKIFIPIEKEILQKIKTLAELIE